MKQIVLLLTLLLCLTACREPEKPSPVLLEVGQRQLTLAQFERELQLRYPDLATLPQAEQLQLKSHLAERLVERELLLGEADRLEIKVSPDELDATLGELRGNYSQAEFNQILREKGQTRDNWLAAIKLRRMTEKVIARAIAPLEPVSSAEVRAYYEKHRDDFRHPAEVRARQMLLKDLPTAHEVLKRLDDGEKFADLAREYSLSPDRETGGDLGYFSRGELPPEFDRVLFRLPSGQVSEPVESPYGLHLFLVERRRKAGLRSLQQVKDEIFSLLTREREEKAFQHWLAGLRQATTVKINRELLTAKSAEPARQ